MFEKSRASNITAQATHIPATITLTTGETLTAQLKAMITGWDADGEPEDR